MTLLPLQARSTPVGVLAGASDARGLDFPIIFTCPFRHTSITAGSNPARHAAASSHLTPNGVANVNWTANVNIAVPAGNYQVSNSGVATWSWNSTSKNFGFAIVRGDYPSGGSPPTGSSACPQGAKGAPIGLLHCPATIRWDGTRRPSTLQILASRSGTPLAKRLCNVWAITPEPIPSAIPPANDGS